MCNNLKFKLRTLHIDAMIIGGLQPDMIAINYMANNKVQYNGLLKALGYSKCIPSVITGAVQVTAFWKEADFSPARGTVIGEEHPVNSTVGAMTLVSCLWRRSLSWSQKGLY